VRLFSVNVTRFKKFKYCFRVVLFWQCYKIKVYNLTVTVDAIASGWCTVTLACIRSVTLVYQVLFLLFIYSCLG